MKAENFAKIIGADFYTGVPDSQLNALCAYLYDTYAISANHVIAANEGNAVALAAGYHLATGKTPVVYLQNSGLGNIVNPVASLLNGKVYGIPCLFIVCNGFDHQGIAPKLIAVEQEPVPLIKFEAAAAVI